MSSPETEPKVKPPPEINCSESITLISQENRPEQYHQFEEESALAIRAALGAKRPLLVRGKPGVGKPSSRRPRRKYSSGRWSLVSSTRVLRQGTCSGNSMP